MINRYKYQKPIIKSDRKRIQGQTLYPPIVPRGTDMYVMVRDGQRLDTLAHQYYGDPGMWWVIAQANNITRGTIFVPPGTQLRIPQDTAKIETALEKINTER